MTNTSTLKERLVWKRDGSLQDGEIRYLLIRTDSLMQLFKQLNREPRLQALESFASSLAENGRKSLEVRMRRLNLSHDQLYDDLARSSGKQLGWGVWSFLRRGRDQFEVSVDNSPFVHGYGPSDHPVCFPIKGILSAMGNLSLNCAVDVEEVACAAVSAGCCRFVVRSKR